MKAKTGLDAALERASHLLSLYDLLCDQRDRGIRSDWSKRFKSFMGWRQSERISRVDGQGTLLILRESTGINRSHFGHDYLSEVLRSALVAAVSALDRYMHDLIVENSWKLLTQRDDEVPRSLADLELPALGTRRALERLRRNSAARPGSMVKAAVQEKLHKDFTFQSPNQLTVASKLLGLKDFWRKVAAQMLGGPSPGEVQDELGRIIKRRNQIVHEADLVPKTKSGSVDLRDITRDYAGKVVSWIEDLTGAIQQVVDADL